MAFLTKAHPIIAVHTPIGGHLVQLVMCRCISRERKVLHSRPARLKAAKGRGISLLLRLGPTRSQNVMTEQSNDKALVIVVLVLAAFGCLLIAQGIVVGLSL